ncbi:MAG: hypothetical protein KF823_03110 [Xanthomonadales bacterium]|nr:hypothetical protein [Xanthomonadales bacterium]
MRALLAVLAGLVLAKAAFLLVDPDPRFFFGDSASYINAATRGWGLRDRSSTYPFLIWLTALPSRSLHVLVLLQSALGAVLAALLYRLLVRDLGVRAGLAALAAVLIALEPMQLYYERTVMAETFGTGFLVAMLLAQCSYFRRPMPAKILLAVGLGLVAVSFRLSLLPTVLVLGSGFPLLWLLARPGLPAPPGGPAAHRPSGRSRPAARRIVVHFGLALLATCALHQGYRVAYGKAVGVDPGYIASSGLFRLAWLAPLLTPGHLDRQGVPPALLQGLAEDPGDRRSREWQMWHPEGLIARLRAARPDDADAVAGRIAGDLLRRQPSAVLALGLATFADHFDVAYADDRMQDDLGIRPPDQRFIGQVQDLFGHDASAWRHPDGLVHRMMVAYRPVLTLQVLIAPLLALALLVLARARATPSLAVLALAILGLAASNILFGHALVFRYLHPLPPLLMVAVAVLADAALRRRRSVDRSIVDVADPGAQPRS